MNKIIYTYPFTDWLVAGDVMHPVLQKEGLDIYETKLKATLHINDIIAYTHMYKWYAYEVTPIL